MPHTDTEKHKARGWVGAGKAPKRGEGEDRVAMEAQQQKQQGNKAHKLVHPKAVYKNDTGKPPKVLNNRSLAKWVTAKPLNKVLQNH